MLKLTSLRGSKRGGMQAMVQLPLLQAHFYLLLMKEPSLKS